VGPNRALGPPLEQGRRYTLTVGSGMRDALGRPMGSGFDKPFRVTGALREPVAVESWRILPPPPQSREALQLIFPRSLDWALLWRALRVASESGEPIEGRIAIDQDEKRWRFTPKASWTPGRYQVRVEPGLEDVCGNDLLGPFDRRVRPAKLSSVQAPRQASFLIA
jgi:hypothetical protein